MLGVIQARLGSTRLPGKVLMEIKGKPLLRYVTERVAMACDQVLVLCPAKDFREIWKACSSADVEIKGIPGDENDVYERFLRGLPYHCRFARICADSPLIDPAVIKYVAIQLYEKMLNGGNCWPKTWPSGQCVEVMDTAEYREPLESELTAEDREHAGMPFFWRTGGLQNVANPLGDFSAVNMCVDTREDFDRISDVIGRMTRPHVEYGWHEIMELMA